MKKSLKITQLSDANEFFPKILVIGSDYTRLDRLPDTLEEGFILEPPEAGFGTEFTLISGHGYVAKYTAGGELNLTLYQTSTGARLDYSFRVGGSLDLSQTSRMFVHKSSKTIYGDNVGLYTYYGGAADWEDVFITFAPLVMAEKDTGNLRNYKFDWLGDGEEEVYSDETGLIDKDRAWAVYDSSIGGTTVFLLFKSGEYYTLKPQDRYDYFFALPDGSIALYQLSEEDATTARVWYDGNQLQVEEGRPPVYISWGMTTSTVIKHSNDGKMFYVSDYEHVTAHDVESGELVWRYWLDPPDQIGQYSRYSETIAINPVNGNIYIDGTGVNNRLFELSPEGILLRTIDLPVEFGGMAGAAISQQADVLFLHDEGMNIFVDLVTEEVTVLPEQDDTIIDYMFIPLMTEGAAYFPSTYNTHLIKVDFEQKALTTVTWMGGIKFDPYPHITSEPDGVLYAGSEVIIKISDDDQDDTWIESGITTLPPAEDTPAGIYDGFSDVWRPPIIRASGTSYIPVTKPGVGDTYGVNTDNIYFKVYKYTDGIEEYVRDMSSGFYGTPLGTWQGNDKFIQLGTNRRKISYFDIGANTETVLTTLSGTVDIGREVTGGDFVMLGSIGSNSLDFRIIRLQTDGTRNESTITLIPPDTLLPATSRTYTLNYHEDRFYIGLSYNVYDGSTWVYYNYYYVYNPVTGVLGDAVQTQVEFFNSSSNITGYGNYIYNFNIGRRFNIYTGIIDDMPGWEPGARSTYSIKHYYVGNSGRVLYCVSSGWDSVFNRSYVMEYVPPINV